MDETTVKQRLILFIKYKNLSQKKFERLCGLSNGYVNNIRQSIMPDKLQIIARQFPELNKSWLLTGDGEMIHSVGDRIRSIVAQTAMPEYSADFVRDPLPSYMLVETRPRIPLRAATGNLREYYAGDKRHLCEQKPLVQQFPPYNFTLLVCSNSMRPYIDTGDIIACAEIAQIISFGDVYILDTDGEVLIRRVFESDTPDRYRLVPDNKEYPEILLDRTAIKGIYRAVGLLRVEI